jgi:GMP synthase-like glutamine amidotransferase
MRVHVLQHVVYEGLGTIENWLERQRAIVTYTRFYESCAFPNLDDIDFVIALGGPMSVHKIEQYPWLIQEKSFIADAIRQDKICLGICLGAQLIACALGGKGHA